MLKRILFLFSVFFLLPSVASAEVIYLRNGRKVEAPIVQKTGYGVVVKVNGALRTYYKNEIERIEESEPETAGKETASEKAAPEVPVPDISEIPPQKAELALRLLDAIGARNNIATAFNKIIQEAPEEDQPRLREFLKVDDVLKSIVPLYAQHYTEKEMKELIRFYLSPLGQKQLKLAPTILDESMRQTILYFQKKMTEYRKTHQ